MSDDSGSTKGALTCEDLKRFKLTLPPHNEQTTLVNAIKAATKKLDDTLARTEREIGLLREYRTRLVADVVTGKLDVRAAARQLPDKDGEFSDGADPFDSSASSDQMPLE